MNVAVIGAGSWGTALAQLAADNGHRVALWGRDPAHVAALVARRENTRYLPGVRLRESITPTADLADAMKAAEVAVLALPSAALRETITAAGDFRGLVVCASKGLERHTARTLDEVLVSVWPRSQVSLLSGPTFVVEVANGRPAAAVAAAWDANVRERVQHVLAGERFRVYTSEDVIGVAIGGAMKNVIAIAAGCSDALGFGANTRAALITRGLVEMGRLTERLGGKALTLSGLAGLGDLVLTCTGELSRNRTVGVALGRGEPLPKIIARLGQVAEGVETAETAAALGRRLGADLPITFEVADVLAGHRSAPEAVARLLSRGLHPE